MLCYGFSNVKQLFVYGCEAGLVSVEFEFSQFNETYNEMIATEEFMLNDLVWCLFL